MGSLRLGRVAAIHPEDHSVDLVMTDDGARLVGVQVMAHSASSNTGHAGLPAPATPSSGNVWDLTESTARDVLAVVAFVGRQPVVLGFLYPQICQMTFADHGRVVSRTPSDFYTTVDGSGNFEAYHPSGTYLRIGSSPSHEDLTGKDFDGQWAIKNNTASSVHVHLSVAAAGATVASVDIDPSGNVQISHNGNLAVNTGGTAVVTAAGNATVNAPDLTVNSPQSTFTGAVTVQGLLTYQDGINGSAGTHGSNISGSVSVTGGDVTADGVGLKTHTHTDPQGGSVGPATG